MSDRAPSLGKNAAWTLVGNVVYAASQWGMLVVLAKLGSPETVGQLALALAITAPVFMLANLNLRALQSTDAWRDFDFGDYLTLRLVTTPCALAIIGGITLIGGTTIRGSIVILFFALAKAVESLSDATYGLFQQRERMDLVSTSLIIRGTLGLFALGAAFVATDSLAAGVAALGGVWTLTFLLFDVPSARRLAGPARWTIWSRHRLASLFILAAPLGIVMMLISLTSNLPRYFLLHYHGVRAVGIYSALVYVMISGAMVVTALGSSASPRLARSYLARDRATYSTLLGQLTLSGLVLGGAAVTVAATMGHALLQLLYGSEYAANFRAFTWMMVAGGLGYVASFLGYGMTAARRLHSQVAVFGASAGACALASAVLIPRSHLLGAAQALLLATLVQLLGATLVCYAAARRIGDAR